MMNSVLGARKDRKERRLPIGLEPSDYENKTNYTLFPEIIDSIIIYLTAARINPFYPEIAGLL
jgi:hypothetical protein